MPNDIDAEIRETAKALAIAETQNSTMPRADMIRSENQWIRSITSAYNEVINGFLFEEFWAERDIPF